MKTPQDMDKQMDVMQESMLKMHEHMHKIMDAKNPQERERLMQQHSKMMQDMHMMQGNAKGGKMDSDMKGM
jgi:2-oxo-4-hydroxy-4-carboxy--5-ureidoimidazoline (OHCU) decarboxylase